MTQGRMYASVRARVQKDMLHSGRIPPHIMSSRVATCNRLERSLSIHQPSSVGVSSQNQCKDVIYSSSTIPLPTLAEDLALPAR